MGPSWKAIVCAAAPGGREVSVFERFTERARQVVVLAQDEARALKHNYIGTEHILLGMLREGEGLAVAILVERGIDLADLRRRAEGVARAA